MVDVGGRRPTGQLWRKTRYSVGNGACIEVLAMPEGMLSVRDSKNPESCLRFTETEWNYFLQRIKAADTKLTG